MIRTDELDRILGEWFGADAAGPSTDRLLAEVADATRLRQPRPAWLARLAWGSRRFAWSRRLGSRATFAILFALMTATAIATAGLYASQPSPTPPVVGRFVPTGAPLTDRLGPTSIALHDGRVLVAGGQLYDHSADSWQLLASTEVWDPSTGSFSAAGSMAVPRSGSSALLLEGGDVLIAGGSRHDPTDLERYSAVAGRFSVSGSLTPEVGLWRLVALVRLSDGRIVASGPTQDEPDTRVYEVDPATLTATRLGTVHGCAQGVAVAALPASQVVVRCQLLGDLTIAVAWEPFGETTSTLVGPVDEQAEGAYLAILPLGDGRILFQEGTGRPVRMYDPATGTTTDIGPVPYGELGGTQLQDGRILFLQGASATLWDPDTGVATPLPDRPLARAGASTTLLPDGRVLILGGSQGVDGDLPQVAGAELFVLGDS